LRETYPNEQLVFLVGGDSLHDLPKWEQPQRLLASCDQLGVMHRTGTKIDLQLLEEQIPGLSAKLVWVDAPLIDISASTIRQRLRKNQPVRYFLPHTVYQTIQERNLYR
jgi:nicotinate-nucleotide adenylyltransferase